MSKTGRIEGGAAVAALMAASELRNWVAVKTATWSSVMVATFNCRPAARTDAGTFVRLDESGARKSIVLLGNMIDRAVHGKLVQRFGRRVPRIPFLEYGSDRGWHCHMLIEPPYSMSQAAFNEVVRRSWAKSPWGTTCHIRGGDDGAAGYLTKARSKEALEVWSDTLIVEAVVLRTK